MKVYPEAEHVNGFLRLARFILPISLFAFMIVAFMIALPMPWIEILH